MKTINKSNIEIKSFGIINALGSNQRQVLESLEEGRSVGMKPFNTSILDKQYHCGVVESELPEIPEKFSQFNCRNNQLAAAALQQIDEDIHTAKQQFGKSRVGVVMGTSTSGIKEAEVALKEKSQSGELPSEFSYKMQEIGALAEFVSGWLDVTGPSYAISTACSSSGKVFSAAARLLDSNICDAVVVGGADSLCDLTLGGFDSLEAISEQPTNPFSVNRSGINIGEAAAVFLLTKKRVGESSEESIDNQPSIQLLGVGESSDAHHMSAPEPNGEGAMACMQAAMDDADLLPTQIDYLNLHGTGTKLNDSMEAKAVHSIFGEQLKCSSTKPMTGHTLGAAGATEVALCCLILKHASNKIAPIHLFDGKLDPELSKIDLISNIYFDRPITTAMSNSFAFGGNNVSVIVGIR
ncbi:MAG: beta-ketoacyl-[acyl-carrier-protein] synthase family protein [Kangiellaceae bacterium]